MRKNLLITALITAALIVLALPVVASGQDYGRDRNRYDRTDWRDVRAAINRLDNSSVRLENDLKYTPGRRVFGIFQLRTVDTTALAEVRDFRRAVRQLRRSSNNGFAFGGSRDEAQLVLDRGVQLDRYLRLRTGSASVDADLSEIRSNLHIIADAFDLRMPY